MFIASGRPALLLQETYTLDLQSIIEMSYQGYH
jgi:hypothetical protein